MGDPESPMVSGGISSDYREVGLRLDGGPLDLLDAEYS